MKFLLRIIIPSLGFIWIFYQTVEITNFHNESPFIFLGLIAIAIGLIIWQIVLHDKRCRVCKKWGVMKVTNKVLTDTCLTHVVKTFTTKNSKGDVISTHEEPVPATKYTYLVDAKCKNCDDEISYYTSETVEN